MKDIFIKTNEFTENELYQINKHTYRDYRNNDIMSIEELFVVVQELLGKCEELEEKLDDEIEYRQDNFKPRSPYDLYGISENDFH